MRLRATATKTAIISIARIRQRVEAMQAARVAAKPRLCPAVSSHTTAPATIPAMLVASVLCPVGSVQSAGSFATYEYRL